MNEIVSLKGQISDGGVVVANKPAQKAQRPKDTVKREQSATSNSNATKVERVDPKKLASVRYILKLKLQETNTSQDNLSEYLLPSSTEVSIAELRKKLEQACVPQSKALLLARYVVEPKTGGTIVFNEQMTCDCEQASNILQQFIGSYTLYKENTKEAER